MFHKFGFREEEAAFDSRMRGATKRVRIIIGAGSYNDPVTLMIVWYEIGSFGCPI